MKNKIGLILTLIFISCNGNQSTTYGKITHIHYKNALYHKVAIDVSNAYSTYTFIMPISDTTISTLNSIMLSEKHVQIYYHKDISEVLIKGKYTGTVDSILCK